MQGSGLRLFEERDFAREQHALLKLAPRAADKADRHAKQAIDKSASSFPGTCNRPARKRRESKELDTGQQGVPR
jgi:hypothetical protein